MRRWLALPALLMLFLAFPSAGRDSSPIEYEVVIDKVLPPVYRDQQLFITVQFRVKRVASGDLVTDLADEVIVEEDGHRVATQEIYRPTSNPLTTVLALDTSGSMNESGKMEEAQRAARQFLDKMKLDSPEAKTDCGLILFDHQMRVRQPPAGEPRERLLLRKHLEKLLRHIDNTAARGGTAYFDAAVQAVEMLKDVRGRKAVVLMTDGVDLNSENKLSDVIDLAQRREVPIYTIGVGQPGKNEPVTTVLVLDRSGSMNDPADDVDRISKIAALREAATRFIRIMRPGARTTLIAFSDRVDRPEPFTNEKDELIERVQSLRARGATMLFDAIYDALQTLAADRAKGQIAGKRHVVVLTDGIDTGSRHSVRDVVRLAQSLEINLYLLGLGRDGEIDNKVMQRMADESGGKFFHVKNRERLIEVFEQLSIDLHDDGIDENSLRELADKTGGKYFHASDIKNLHLYYEQLAEELQSTYTVTYPSRRSSYDGTTRGIDISIGRNGVRISNVASDQYERHGVVVPEMHPVVYLALLAILGSLLLLPAGLRRLYKFYGGV